MTLERLDSWMLIYIEQNITTEIDPEQVIEELKEF